MTRRARYAIGGAAAVLLGLELLFWVFAVAAYFTFSRVLPHARLERPDYLLAQLGGPLIVVLFLLHLGWRNRAIRRFGEAGLMGRLAPGINNVRTTLRFVLLRSGYAWLAFALCGPQLGTRREEVKARGVDVIVALDVSNSMLAVDKGFRESRMTIATRALEQLIGKLHGDRLGIVVFAGQAYTQLPLTADRSAAKLFLGSIGPDMVPVQGTAIGAAIRQARDGFDPKSKAGRTIIVITDGENHEDDAVAEAEAAAAQNIVVSAVGLGSTGGAPLPLEPGRPEAGFRKDKEGNTVLSKLNVAMLERIAAAGKGAFVQATPQRTGVQQLVDDMRAMERSDLGTITYTGHEDRFQFFLLVGCVLIFAGMVTGERSFSVPSTPTIVP